MTSQAIPQKRPVGRPRKHPVAEVAPPAKKPRRKADDASRAGVNAFLTLAAAAAIGFNVWAATTFYSGFPAFVFCVGVFAIEVVAFLSLRHIIRDWDNNHRFKPGAAGVIFAFMVILCAFTGHHGFGQLEIQRAETVKEFKRKAEEAEARAAVHMAAAQAAIAADNRGKESQELARREKELEKAAAERLKIAKNKPLPGGIVIVFLICFEAVKVWGRWALGTPTQKTWTLAQRRASRDKQKAKEAEAKAARKLAENKNHLHAVRS